MSSYASHQYTSRLLSNFNPVFIGLLCVLLYELAFHYGNFFNFFAIPADLTADSPFYYAVLSYDLLLVTLINLAVLFLYQKLTSTHLSIKTLALMQFACSVFVITTNGITADFSSAYAIYQNITTLYMCIALVALGSLFVRR